jgi:protein O-mannosyl-transferase
MIRFSFPYWWRRYFFVFTVLLVILLLSYSNSFHCSWHFDDYDNIVENNSIQIREISWDSFKNLSHGVISNTEGKISRPFSYFSFALNFYFGGLNVFGFHVINFIIHFLSSIFLFLFIFNTLKLPLLNQKYGENAYPIALLATLFWAINPVHVTAITYIVQRMASMVALFYIISMYFYLKFRTASTSSNAIGLIVLSIISFLLALGTKENAAMLPISIFLYDLFFIQGLTTENVKKSLKILLPPLIVVIIAGLIFYDFSAILRDYKIRPFTMVERLLTEPRIILFYITLLFYPLSSRLTMIHDIELSKSLFDPWTTFIAIIVIFIIIAFCFIKAKKWPLITYCILFFFINHFIEGSFISLELIFEHRNYLPSMLLFVPVALLLVNGLNFYSQKKKMQYIVAGVIPIVIIIMSVTVYLQNITMSDEISLWSDNVEKSPRLLHPHYEYGVALFKSGHLQEASVELKKAEQSYEAAAIPKRSVVYAGIGEYYYQTGDYERSLEYYKKSIDWYPNQKLIAGSYYRAGMLLTKKGLLDEAEKMLNSAITLKPYMVRYYLAYCELLIKKNKPDESIAKAREVLKLYPGLKSAYQYMADAYALKKDKKSESYYRALSNDSKQ